MMPVWKLEGYDTCSRESYSLGEYDSREAVFAAALDRLDELERTQPSQSSGGQWGIQDQVFIINPDGKQERITPRPRFPSNPKYYELLNIADVPFHRLVKAARAVLGWTQIGLAERAEIGASMVADFERETTSHQTSPESIRKMRSAIEAAGVTFVPGGIWSEATGNVILTETRPLNVQPSQDDTQ
jgi:hypothetical protein